MSDGEDRRSPEPILAALHSLHVEMTDRLGRIEQEAKGTNARLDNHSERIEAVVVRTTSLEASRDFAKGIIKGVGVPVAAIGSLAWMLTELGKFIKSLKGGG